MAPTTGEVPQVDWPVIAIAGQQLVVRWTFYAQWVLSKRKVNVRDLAAQVTAMKNNGTSDPGLLDTIVECFAAAVAENYTPKGLIPPTPDQWALTISSDPAAWAMVNKAFWEAVGKAKLATAPQTSQETAKQGTTALAN